MPLTPQEEQELREMLAEWRQQKAAEAAHLRDTLLTASGQYNKVRRYDPGGPLDVKVQQGAQPVGN